MYSDALNLKDHHQDLETARAGSNATTRARVDSASEAVVGHVFRGRAAITPRWRTRTSVIQSCSPCSLGLRESWPHSMGPSLLGVIVHVGSRSSDPSSAEQLAGLRRVCNGNIYRVERVGRVGSVALRECDYVHI